MSSKILSRRQINKTRFWDTKFRPSALAIGGLGLFLIAGCPQQSEKTPPSDAVKVTDSSNLTPIRIGWQIAWATQGQLSEVLQHTNALSLNGLQGNFQSFTYGAPLSEAALSGGLDVGFFGDQPAMNLLSNSKDWKIVARLMDFRVAIVVPPNSSIKKVGDLKGKTLGIPFGASTHRVALQMLADAGLDAKKDVKIINIDIQEQGDVIRAAGGKPWRGVDAFASWDHHIALYESKGLAKILKSGKALGVVAMSEKFRTAHPDKAANFLAAFKLAYLYYATHQDQADKWFADAAGGKFDLKLLRQVASIEPNLKAKSLPAINIALSKENIALFQNAAAFAYQQKLIKTPLKVDASLDLNLLKEADNNLTTHPKITSQMQATPQ